MSAIPYRPDIDGLRAVAVLAVLFYHAGFSGLPGGFMGVDIFFVISGYLITSFIARDLAVGEFSMVAFWERRARRILPPLFAVVGASIIAGLFLFLPMDFMQLAKETISQSVFGSNFLFLKQGGYFNTSNEIKVLLHTWSLAVEEQFYLFFPIGMYLWWRFVKRNVLLLLIPCAIISFVMCVVVTGMMDRIAFYMLPFRGWELLAGSILAVSSKTSANKAVRESVSFFGLALIAYSILFYSGAPFPGSIALLPVLGTVMIIWAKDSAVSSLLSLKPVVAIGLISYSLYLWHWPIMAYVRYQPFIEFTAGVGLACIGASVLLATATYFVIEQPIRKRRILSSRRSIFLFSLAGLLLIAVAGAVIIATKGMPQRFDDDVLALEAGARDWNVERWACDQPDIERIKSGGLCQTNPEAGAPDFILWGDSHADAIAPLFYALSKKHGRNGYVVTGHGCPPIIGGGDPATPVTYDCNAANEATIDFIRQSGMKDVFLVSNWQTYLHSSRTMDGAYMDWYDAGQDQSANPVAAALNRTIGRISEGGARIHILYNIPYAPIDPPRALALERLHGYEGASKTVVSVEAYHKALENERVVFATLDNHAINYIEPEKVLCDNAACYAEKDGKSLYFNMGHLSAFGATQLAPLFEESFAK